MRIIKKPYNFYLISDLKFLQEIYLFYTVDATLSDTSLLSEINKLTLYNCIELWTIIMMIYMYIYMILLVIWKFCKGFPVFGCICQIGQHFFGFWNQYAYLRWLPMFLWIGIWLCSSVLLVLFLRFSDGCASVCLNPDAPPIFCSSNSRSITSKFSYVLTLAKIHILISTIKYP